MSNSRRGQSGINGFGSINTVCPCFSLLHSTSFGLGAIRVQPCRIRIHLRHCATVCTPIFSRAEPQQGQRLGWLQEGYAHRENSNRTRLSGGFHQGVSFSKMSRLTVRLELVFFQRFNSLHHYFAILWKNTKFPGKQTMALDASIGHVPTDVEAPCTSDFGFCVVPFFPSGSLLRISLFSIPLRKSFPAAHNHVKIKSFGCGHTQPKAPFPVRSTVVKRLRVRPSSIVGDHMRNSHAAIFFLVREPDYEPWPMGLTLNIESTREGKGYPQGGCMCGLTLVTGCSDSLHN